jgi:hypothetical protein
VKAEIITELVRRATADQWCRLVMDLALMAPMQALSAAVLRAKMAQKLATFVRGLRWSMLTKFGSSCL